MIELCLALLWIFKGKWTNSRCYVELGRSSSQIYKYLTETANFFVEWICCMLLVANNFGYVGTKIEAQSPHYVTSLNSCSDFHVRISKFIFTAYANMIFHFSYLPMVRCDLKYSRLNERFQTSIGAKPMNPTWKPLRSSTHHHKQNMTTAPRSEFTRLCQYSANFSHSTEGLYWWGHLPRTQRYLFTLFWWSTSRPIFST